MTDKIQLGNPDNKSYWLNKDTVQQFASKPADAYVEERISSIVNPETKRALDLGCGGGRHTEMLASKHFDTYGCDVNSSMIFQTRGRMAKYYPEDQLMERVTYGSILSLPYPDNHFDTVVTTGVLHQAKSLSEYQKAISELSRVTKSGAIITAHIFTNMVMDDTYKQVANEQYSVTTKEGLYMTLIPKELFYELMALNGIILEAELDESIRDLETGQRAILKANFIKN